MDLKDGNNERIGIRLYQPSDKSLVEPAALVTASCFNLGLVCKESLLFAVDLVLPSVKVGFVGSHHLGLHEKLVSEDANQVDRNALA